MAEQRENSVLFSLKELRRIEDDRIRQEETEAQAKVEAERRSREEAERRAREDVERRRREEEDRVRRIEEEKLAHEREGQLRLQEAERRARVEAETRLQEERMRLEVQHKKHKSPMPIVLAVAAVFVVVGGTIIHERVSQGGLPTYPGGKAFLFEINPQFMPPRIENTLFEIRITGRLPVMAHPERYLAIQEDIGRAEAIGRSAALLLDLGALDGAHGRPAMKAARKLMEAGLIHAAASDVHTAEDQRTVAAGMAWIKKRLGPDALERLVGEHPRWILSGELP